EMEIRAGLAASALARLNAVTPAYRGFETRYLEFRADTALARYQGPQDGVMISSAEGPRWCGRNGSSCLLRPQEVASVDVAPVESGQRVDAGTVASGGWYRVVSVGDRTRLDFFSGSVCVHTFDFPAKDPERRRWAYADEDDAVWTVDGSGRVERLSQNNDLLRSALDGDPSTWRLIVARDR